MGRNAFFIFFGLSHGNVVITFHVRLTGTFFCFLGGFPICVFMFHLLLCSRRVVKKNCSQQLTHTVWQQTAIHTHSCHVSCSIDRNVFCVFFVFFLDFQLHGFMFHLLLRDDCRHQLTCAVWQLTTINTFSYTFHFGWWAGTYFSFFLDFHMGRTFTLTVSLKLAFVFLLTPKLARFLIRRTTTCKENVFSFFHACVTADTAFWRDRSMHEETNFTNTYCGRSKVCS